MKKVLVLAAVVLLLAGCDSTSVSYDANPTAPHNKDADIQCVQVDRVVSGWNNDYYPVGLFCRVDQP